MVGDTFGTLPGQSNSGGRDAFLRKYDPNGNELWTRQFGSSAGDGAWSVSTDATGVYVVGNTRGSLPGYINIGAPNSDSFVRKYDSAGNELWTRQFGSGGYDDARAVTVDANGVYVAGLVVAGALPGQTALRGDDAYVRKYDSNGNELWTRQFGTSSIDWAFGVATDASGVYVAGYTRGTLSGQTSAGDGDAFVRKYDTDGNELWTRQFGSGSLDILRSASSDLTGIYVAGTTFGTLPDQNSFGGHDMFVRKYDGSGNELWTRQFGTSADDWAGESGGRSVISTAGGIYFVGITYGAFPGQTSAGGADVVLVKFTKDADGDGVFDDVDTNPSVYSNDFTDIPLGGTSEGSIVNRNGLSVRVEEESNPAGHRLSAFDDPAAPGTGPAEISYTCDGTPYTLSLSDGANGVITCGSLTVQTLSGVIQVVAGANTVVTVSSGATVKITEETPQQFRIENAPQSTGQVTVQSNGQVLELPAGEATLTPPPNKPPVAKCKNVTVSAGPDCMASADVNDGSSDPDGDPITLKQNLPGPYPLGNTVVTLTVADSHGASSTCTATVTVRDDTPPKINCPSEIVVGTEAGQCSAKVTFLAYATDNCDNAALLPVVCNAPSGSVFPKGTTTVTCAATDKAGNKATSSFTVTVQDREAPVAGCIPTTNPAGSTVPKAGDNPKSGQNPDGFYQLVATDNCDSSPKIFVRDSASDFVAGPFQSGDKVKITQAPGVTPNQKPMAGAIVVHLQLKGDALVYALDAAGNQSLSSSCLVPPPPK